jgi:hypothetical protein
MDYFERTLAEDDKQHLATLLHYFEKLHGAVVSGRDLWGALATAEAALEVGAAALGVCFGRRLGAQSVGKRTQNPGQA